MALTRRRVLAFGREPIEGSAIATGSLTAYELAIDPTVSMDTPKKRRRLANAVLMEQAALEGLKSGSMTFTAELAGHSSGLVRPVWADLVEACGWRSYLGAAAFALPAGAITGGPFVDGEAITSGAKSGTVMGTYYDGVSHVIVESYSGSAPSNAETWTGGTSGATVTTTAAGPPCTTALKPYSERTYQISGLAPSPGTLAAGVIVTGATSGAKALVLAAKSGTDPLEYMPIDGTGNLASGEVVSDGTNSFTSTSVQTNLYIPSLTMALWDSVKLKVIKGARGTLSFAAPVGEEARMSFTFTGAREAVSDDTLPASVTQVVASPPVLIGGSSWIDDQTDMALREFSLDFGAAVALRPSPSEASGYISARIGNRAVGGTVNPEVSAEAALDIYEKARDSEAFQLGISYGTTATNRVFINVPRAQADQVNAEDQDGLQHDALAFIATGDSATLDGEVVVAIF